MIWTACRVLLVFRQRVENLSPWLFRLFFGDEIRPSYMGIINMINRYKYKEPVIDQPGFHEFRILRVFSLTIIWMRIIIIFKSRCRIPFAAGSWAMKKSSSWAGYVAMFAMLLPHLSHVKKKPRIIRNPSDIRRLVKMTESDFFMALWNNPHINRAGFHPLSKYPQITRVALFFHCCNLDLTPISLITSGNGPTLGNPKGQGNASTNHGHHFVPL